MLLTSLPVTPPLTPPPRTTQLSLSKTLGCSIPPGCAFASLAVPVAHRQHHLHQPHQRLPRMRMMQVMLGMLPMLVKEMKGGKGKGSQQRKGGKDLREAREKIWGKNALRGKGGKRSLGGKWRSFSGGTGPKGQWEEREKIWGKNALRVLRSFPPFPLRPLQIFSLFLPKIVSRLSLLRSFPPFPPSGLSPPPESFSLFLSFLRSFPPFPVGLFLSDLLPFLPKIFSTPFPVEILSPLSPLRPLPPDLLPFLPKIFPPLSLLRSFPPFPP